jgi:MarR family transcriptional regulator, organic hydroperoxide resistance regulator
MKPEETIDFHIRWTWARLSKVYNNLAEGHGGSMAMAYALLSIDKAGTLSTQLGPSMGMAPTGMTRLIRSLEDQSYIRRVADKADKRKVWLHLTPKGKRYRDLSKEHVIRLNTRIRKRIPKEKLNAFFEVITLINNELDLLNIQD